jgi:hypothetical protein
MNDSGDDSDKPDDLLNKLDGFLRSGRKHYRRNRPPVLTDALADDSQGSIPTLTNAFENARLGSGDNEVELEERVKEAVTSKLLASVDQEMEELAEAFPEFQDKLALLHRSVRFALPQLVSLRWGDADDDTVAADDDAITADDDPVAANETGTNPDQQS